MVDGKHISLVYCFIPKDGIFRANTLHIYLIFIQYYIKIYIGKSNSLLYHMYVHVIRMLFLPISFLANNFLFFWSNPKI